MNTRSVIYLTLLLFLFAFSFSVRAQDVAPSGKGTLVVLVTHDDVDKTPPTGVYIEAHSFDGAAEKPFVFKMVKAGRYEAAIPPGVYDVFVSDPDSTPRCRRLLITAGRVGYWSLMLEHDDIYLER
jgi:hypothetical protein